MSVDPKLQSQTRPPETSGSVIEADSQYVAIVRNVISADPPVSESRSRAIGFTSALSGEGASTVATNFALTVAALNIGRVLLVDANETRPGLHRLFHQPDSVGLQTALAEKCEPLECVLPTPVQRLSLVCQGQLPVGGTMIHGLVSVERLLNQWRAAFSWIVFDLPPADSMTNCAFLASRLDATLLVVEAGRLDRRAAERASNYLRNSGVHLLGAVCNKVPGRDIHACW